MVGVKVIAHLGVYDTNYMHEPPGVDSEESEDVKLLQTLLLRDPELPDTFPTIFGYKNRLFMVGVKFISTREVLVKIELLDCLSGTWSDRSDSSVSDRYQGISCRHHIKSESETFHIVYSSREHCS